MALPGNPVNGMGYLLKGKQKQTFQVSSMGQTKISTLLKNLSLKDANESKFGLFSAVILLL